MTKERSAEIIAKTKPADKDNTDRLVKKAEEAVAKIEQWKEYKGTLAPGNGASGTKRNELIKCIMQLEYELYLWEADEGILETVNKKLTCAMDDVAMRILHESRTSA